MKLSFEMQRFVCRPQRLQDCDLFIHERVTVFFLVLDAFFHDLNFRLPRDQVDADATVRHHIEG